MTAIGFVLCAVAWLMLKADSASTTAPLLLVVGMPLLAMGIAAFLWRKMP